MRVALVQFLAGNDPADNRVRLLALVREALARGAELVVCPEASMHGFGRPADPLAPVAEALDGPFVTALVQALTGSAATVVAGMFEATGQPPGAFNTVVTVTADGLRAAYRKVHLFDSAGWTESARLATVPVIPDALPVTGCGPLQVGVLTCYDLRFPELARALVDRGATALAVPAAWVAGPIKEEQWRVLLRARAIENGVWVLAAGQPGPPYTGCSMAVDPAGVELAVAAAGEGITLAEVDPDRVSQIRSGMPSLAHRRFQVVPGPVVPGPAEPVRVGVAAG